MEARRTRRDVEVFASRDLELGRHAMGLGTLPQKRCLPQEFWRHAEGVAMRRYGSLDVRNSHSTSLKAQSAQHL